MRSLATSIILYFLVSFNSWAGDSYQDFKHSVKLLSAYDSSGDLNEIKVGLHFKFEDQWKTYWRNPGIVGYPLSIKTNGSINIKDVEIHWPVPEEFTTFELKSYGYSHEVILPISVVLEEPGQETVINFELKYLVCDPGNCIPETVKLSLTIPPLDINGNLAFTPSSNFDLIYSYLYKVPIPDSGKGMTIERVEIDTSNDNHHTLYVSAYNPAGFESPEIFFETDAYMYIDIATIDISKDKKRAKFKANIYLTEFKNKPPEIDLTGNQVTITLKDGADAIEAPRQVNSLTTAFATPLLMALFAFLGGFILNFMPCVLPVISMKLLKVVGQGGLSRARISFNFGLTVLGLLLSFWIIAGLAILMKSFGYAVGWGVQFTHPGFLIGIILVIALFAYNLLGWFEIMLSSRAATAISQAGPTRDSPLQYFLSGAFVTLLATPCTAPFLGTALSFALSSSSFVIFYIFTAMGLGLALPFILITLFPGFANYMPKPGMWMIILKKALSIPLFLTIIWLLWTLSSHIGSIAAYALAASVVGIGGLLYLKHKGKSAKLIWLTVLFISAGSFFIPHWLTTESVKKDLSQSVWQVFSSDLIDDYVAEGKVVFVDVTADWCLTCKANEALVLNSDRIQKVLGQENVIAMYADWTRGDAEITAFLRRFGKYGVPFYAVFGPAAPEGISLPELLTTEIVEDSISQAFGKKGTEDE